MSTTETLSLFQRGETLVVSPSNDDDPEATKRNGQTCVFQRYGMTGLCQVRFSGESMPCWFRPGDLRRKA